MKKLREIKMKKYWVASTFVLFGSAIAVAGSLYAYSFSATCKGFSPNGTPATSKVYGSGYCGQESNTQRVMNALGNVFRANLLKKCQAEYPKLQSQPIVDLQVFPSPAPACSPDPR